MNLISQAIHGGTMKAGHFEMVRNTTNRKLEENRMFAIWRIDPPWKSVTKKGQGNVRGQHIAANCSGKTGFAPDSEKMLKNSLFFHK